MGELNAAPHGEHSSSRQNYIAVQVTITGTSVLIADGQAYALVVSSAIASPTIDRNSNVEDPGGDSTNKNIVHPERRNKNFDAWPNWLTITLVVVVGVGVLLAGCVVLKYTGITVYWKRCCPCERRSSPQNDSLHPYYVQ